MLSLERSKTGTETSTKGVCPLSQGPKYHADNFHYSWYTNAKLLEVSGKRCDMIKPVL